MGAILGAAVGLLLGSMAAVRMIEAEQPPQAENPIVAIVNAFVRVFTIMTTAVVGPLLGLAVGLACGGLAMALAVGLVGQHRGGETIQVAGDEPKRLPRNGWTRWGALMVPAIPFAFILLASLLLDLSSFGVLYCLALGLLPSVIILSRRAESDLAQDHETVSGNGARQEATTRVDGVAEPGVAPRSAAR